MGVNLSAFAGQSIKIRFKGTWGAGDFWFDLDNINLRSCPASMGLTYTTTAPTGGQNNGTATVQVGIGNPPFHYQWSNGATTQTATGLPLGEVIVTVTDSKGCSDVLTVNILTTTLEEIDGLTSLNLFPNPTTGLTQLAVSLERPADVQVEIVDLLGRRIWEHQAGHTDRLYESLDLSGFTSGLYLLRLTVDGRTVTKKLIKQ